MNKLRSAALALLALTSVSTAAFAATNVVPKPPITTPVLPPKAAANNKPALPPIATNNAPPIIKPSTNNLPTNQSPVSSQQAKTNPAIHGQSSQPTTPDMMRFQEKS